MRSIHDSQHELAKSSHIRSFVDKTRFSSAKLYMVELGAHTHKYRKEIA